MSTRSGKSALSSQQFRLRSTTEKCLDTPDLHSNLHHSDAWSHLQAVRSAAAAPASYSAALDTPASSSAVPATSSSSATDTPDTSGDFAGLATPKRENCLQSREDTRSFRKQRNPQRRRTARWWASVILTYAFLIGGMLLSALPFLISILTSLRAEEDFTALGPLSLPSSFTFDNYRLLFTDHTFYVPLIVTLQMVAVIVIGQLVTSVLAAYAFARLSFPGRDTIFWLYLSTLMIPAVVLMIPIFSGVAALGWRNTFTGLVLPFVLGSPYAIFMLRESFRRIPQEILDAAKVDGAGHWRQLFSIILPMSRPIIATLLVISIVSQWNSFMWPKTIAPAPNWNVLSVATSALQTQYAANWTLVMAATTVTVCPLLLLFIIFHRQIVRSLSSFPVDR